jgi:hypothetical protein
VEAGREGDQAFPAARAMGALTKFFENSRDFCRTIFVVGNTIRRPPGNAPVFIRKAGHGDVRGPGSRQEGQTCENLMLGQEQVIRWEGQLNVTHPSSVGRR